MDWTTIIVSLMGALATGGGIGGIFHAKEIRRTKKLENDKAAAEEWKELYQAEKERSDAREAALNAKIDDLYKYIGEQRETISTQRETIDTLNTQVAVSALRECRKIACVDRDPPFGSHLEPKDNE